MREIMIAAVCLSIAVLSGCMLTDKAASEVRDYWDEHREEITAAAVEAAKDAAAVAVAEVKEKVEESNLKVETTLDINLPEFDINEDGRIGPVEAVFLAKEMKERNKEKGSPIGAGEALLYLAMVVGGLWGGRKGYNYAKPRILNSERHAHDETLKAASNGKTT